MKRNNRRFVMNMMSFALVISSLAMIPAFCASLYFREADVTRVMAAMIIAGLTAGAAGLNIVRSSVLQVRPRICYMTALFTWLLLIAVSVIVFFFGAPGYTVTDALLESTASWTTTAVSAYDTSALPLSLQLWRSTCNWLGGIGIIMIALTIFRPRKFIGWNLASTEFPGPTFLKNEFPFRTSYRKAAMIYAAFTAVQLVLLTALGMDAFTALLTSLSNISTAGLLHLNGGVVAALSMPVKTVLTLFAFIGSVNITFFMLLIMKKFKELRSSSEIKFYCWRILITAVLVTVFIMVSDPDNNPLRLLWDVLMQSVSFLSTSGYIIMDCSVWTPVCLLLILLQLFIGACSMSTGGGIKVSRIIIAFKTISLSVYRHIHPDSVRSMTINKKIMKSSYVTRANLYIALFMITYILGALLLSFDNMSLLDSLLCSQAMITNTGTSAGELAASGLAGHFTPYTKSVMCLLMLAGRLELYPILMMFFRTFWKADTSM